MEIYVEIFNLQTWITKNNFYVINEIDVDIVVSFVDNAKFMSKMWTVLRTCF